MGGTFWSFLLQCPSKAYYGVPNVWGLEEGFWQAKGLLIDSFFGFANLHVVRVKNVLAASTQAQVEQQQKVSRNLLDMNIDSVRRELEAAARAIQQKEYGELLQQAACCTSSGTKATVSSLGFK